MAEAPGSTCSDLSSFHDEPMEGTAPEKLELTVFLPHPGPWPHDPIDAEGLGGSGGPLDTLLKRFDARLQLIRRPAAEVSLLFIARTRRDLYDVHAFPAPPLNDLSALEALLKAPERGKRVEEPLHFVCTHGRRDVCCSRLGMPVFQALREVAGERVFQTSHLGGHRFAPLILTLPLGASFGRVTAAEAAALDEAARRGELYSVEKLRGIHPYTAEEQIALRRALLSGADFKDFSVVQEDELITVQSSGITRRYRIRRQPGELRMVSCGAAPSRITRFIVDELQHE